MLKKFQTKWHQLEFFIFSFQKYRKYCEICTKFVTKPIFRLAYCLCQYSKWRPTLWFDLKLLYTTCDYLWVTPYFSHCVLFLIVTVWISIVGDVCNAGDAEPDVSFVYCTYELKRLISFYWLVFNATFCTNVQFSGGW